MPLSFPWPQNLLELHPGLNLDTVAVDQVATTPEIYTYLDNPEWRRDSNLAQPIKLSQMIEPSATSNVTFPITNFEAIPRHLFSLSTFSLLTGQMTPPPTQWISLLQGDGRLGEVSKLDEEQALLHPQDQLDDPYCATLLDQQTITPLATSLNAVFLPLEQTFQLHSNPSANHTIYLDFTGYTTQNTAWNNYFNNPVLISPAYDTDGNPAAFSELELAQIQRIWLRVAEDFSPFNVNVTTDEPVLGDLVKDDAADNRWGIRVVITKDTEQSGAGGLAYINSFNWNSDTPVWIYNSSEIGIAAAISHEVGHSLGLSHDGTTTTSYYAGHGSGETGWGPIMGSGYYQNVTTWDNGTYFNTNNGDSTANYGKGPDDLAIITSYNGLGYRPDDHGDLFTTATTLSVEPLGPDVLAVSQFGYIERSTDQDYFVFSTGSGLLNLNFNSYYANVWIDDGTGHYTQQFVPTPFDGDGSSNDQGSNLDIQAKLFDANQTLLATSNPDGLSASFKDIFLTAGQYFIQVDGVGWGDPNGAEPSGYSDYGSLGQYYISGTIMAPSPVTSIVVTPTTGLVTTETGQANHFTVVLSHAPTSDVVIPVTSSNPLEGQVNAQNLVFTPANWNLPQTLTVQGVDDPLDDDDCSYAIQLGPVASADPQYQGLDPSDVQVTNQDNEERILRQTELFADSFETVGGSNQWQNDNQQAWVTSTQRAYQGQVSMEVDGRANNATLTLANSIDLTGYDHVQLSFAWLIERNWDLGEYMALDLFDGETWTEAARISGDLDPENVWQDVNLFVSPRANFNLRFRSTVSDLTEDGNIDEIRIVGSRSALISTDLAGNEISLTALTELGAYGLGDSEPMVSPSVI
ncbi:zinc-dependent metalloprotease family protein [Synechocystis sp. LKSZ1]|uniref:zinc-dependent metalloprotease family protein n=1 Tax=Synechocystis sp. LKSZ1 TaxID=3144951 RepID=UPI00336BD3B3